MKKLKLEVETLRVESFKTAEDRPEPRGTVRGHAPWPPLGTAEWVVVIPSDQIMPSDLCSLGCAESADSVCAVN
jgi:hypothetical protein